AVEVQERRLDGLLPDAHHGDVLGEGRLVDDGAAVLPRAPGPVVLERPDVDAAPGSCLNTPLDLGRRPLEVRLGTLHQVEHFIVRFGRDLVVRCEPADRLALGGLVDGQRLAELRLAPPAPAADDVPLARYGVGRDLAGVEGRQVQPIMYSHVTRRGTAGRRLW